MSLQTSRLNVSGRGARAVRLSAACADMNMSPVKLSSGDMSLTRFADASPYNDPNTSSTHIRRRRVRRLLQLQHCASVKPLPPWPPPPPSSAAKLAECRLSMSLIQKVRLLQRLVGASSDSAPLRSGKGALMS